MTEDLGPTRTLAHWLANFDLDAVPAAVIARAKDILLDGMGCALVGAHLPWSQRAVEAVAGFEGEGKSTIIGWDRTIGAPAAVLLNSTFIQGFELDDFHPIAPLHSASLVAPALLAAAETKQDADGMSFLRGAIAGFETGPRIGRALHGGQMLSRGWHSGPVFGTHAAAAAVGVLIGLDSARMEDALGLAATQSAGLMAAQYEAMGKRMQHGFAARNGYYAAMLAQAGYTGIKRVYEREYGGFLAVYGEGHAPDASQIAAELGARWETQTIALKPYAAMGGLHAPLDIILDLDARETLVPEDVASIDVYLSHAVYHHGWWPPERPLTEIGAQMNVGYAVAVAVIDKAAMARQFSPQRIDSDDLWRLIPRITAHHEARYDARPELRGACRIVVRLKDGRTREGERMLSDTIAKPLDRDGVVRKFHTLADDVIGRARAERIRDLVLNLERASIAELTGRFAAKRARRSDFGSSSMSEHAETVVENAIATLREAIRDGRLAQGQRLVVADVKDLLGVSAGPVREAIRRLTGEGLVDVVPHKGAIVRRFSSNDVREIFEAREVVEGLAARLAAEKIDQGDNRRRLKACRDGMKRAARDGLAYIQHNQEFHRLVYELADNRRVAELADQLTLPIYRLQYHRLMDPAHIGVSMAEHAALIDAILAGDGARAEQLMRAHVRHSGQAMLDAVKAAEGPRS